MPKREKSKSPRTLVEAPWRRRWFVVSSSSWHKKHLLASANPILWSWSSANPLLWSWSSSNPLLWSWSRIKILLQADFQANNDNFGCTRTLQIFVVRKEKVKVGSTSSTLHKVVIPGLLPLGFVSQLHAQSFLFQRKKKLFTSLTSQSLRCLKRMASQCPTPPISFQTSRTQAFLEDMMENKVGNKKHEGGYLHHQKKPYGTFSWTLLESAGVSHSPFVKFYSCGNGPGWLRSRKRYGRQPLCVFFGQFGMKEIRFFLRIHIFV